MFLPLLSDRRQSLISKLFALALRRIVFVDGRMLIGRAKTDAGYGCSCFLECTFSSFEFSRPVNQSTLRENIPRRKEGLAKAIRL